MFAAIRQMQVQPDDDCIDVVEKEIRTKTNRLRVAVIFLNKPVRANQI